MARAAKPKPAKTLEQTLWEAADKLRGNQEPSEYKHVVLGLVFLKYISDRFEERRATLEAELAADGIKPERLPDFLEDRDEYTSHNVFWVPELARWGYIQSVAKQPEIGQQIDQAMDLIEKENPTSRGVLPRNYGRDGLDKRRLGELVDLIGSIGFTETDDHGADDVLGRVYEYFLGQFAGKDAGAFYTPRWVVKLLVEMLELYTGRVYDPAAGWWDAKLADDPRWKYGTPPAGNANFAWVQHFMHHLSPKGTAGFVLANGSLSSRTGGEGEICRKLVEAGLVDCIVAMPDKLFFNTGIPVALWFVSRTRHGSGHRKCRGEVLFIDARKLGTMETRRLRVLTDDDIAKIAGAYHAWRNHDGGYEDVPGFTKAASLAEIAEHDFILTPGRYVGAAEADDEPIDEKIERLTNELFAEFKRGRELEDEVRPRLGALDS